MKAWIGFCSITPAVWEREREREHMFVRRCVWESEKNIVVASFYKQTWTIILHPICKQRCCQAASESQRKTHFITLVFLSALFEHLPSQTLANQALKSLSVPYCYQIRKYPSIATTEERGLHLTQSHHRSKYHRQNQTKLSGLEVLVIVLNHFLVQHLHLCSLMSG